MGQVCDCYSTETVVNHVEILTAFPANTSTKKPSQTSNGSSSGESVFVKANFDEMRFSSSLYGNMFRDTMDDEKV